MKMKRVLSLSVAAAVAAAMLAPIPQTYPCPDFACVVAQQNGVLFRVHIIAQRARRMP